MLIILDEQGRITTPEQVDEYVSARIPALSPLHDTSPEANQQRRLWHYVTSMMLHDCNAACMERKLIRGVEREICKKNFPKPYSDRTELSGMFYIVIRLYYNQHICRCSLHQLYSFEWI